MDPPQSAFFQFRQVAKTLTDMSDRQQVTMLKFELFHALERGNDFQDRSRALEARVSELDARLAAKGGLEEALDAHLHAELLRARLEFKGARAQHGAELASLRLELLAAETQCEALDELCRSLLLTIEQAAEDHVEQPNAEPEPQASLESEAAAP